MTAVRKPDASRFPMALFLLAGFGVAACIGVEAQSMPGEGWYASDSLGMAYESVSGPKDSAWSLEIAGRGASRRSTLYKDLVAVRTTVREYGSSGNLQREAVEEKGILSEESTFDADGRPLLARRFLADGVVEETGYGYIDGKLLVKETSRGGKVLETVRYVYSPDGRLVSAKASNGAFYGSGKTVDGVASMWRMGPDGLELRGYDASGRLASVRVYDGVVLKRRETRIWAGNALERSSIVTSDGTTTVTAFEVSGAAAGSILTLTVERAGLVESRERRAYDDAGRLKRVESEIGGKRASTEYAYDDQGVLAMEKRLLERDQALVIHYVSKTEIVEENYRGDVLFARVSYQDGRRVKEELFKDGVIVRTRTFE